MINLRNKLLILSARLYTGWVHDSISQHKLIVNVRTDDNINGDFVLSSNISDYLKDKKRQHEMPDIYQS